jgi:hypothetical protein
MLKREKLTSKSQEQRLIAMRDYSTAVVQNAQQQIDGENRSEDKKTGRQG